MPFSWTSYRPTKHPGVRRRPSDGAFVIRVRQRHPKTGKKIQIIRILTDSTIEDAVGLRAAIAKQLKNGTYDNDAEDGRTTLTDYAKLWLIRKKTEGVRPHTLSFYLDVLEKRILPHLGDLYLHTITSRDIFRWKDIVTTLRKQNGVPFSRWTVAGWFAVLRNILSDAVVEYDLPRNPATGIPGVKKPRRPRAERYLPLPKLKEFLALVREHHSDHYAITLVLACYGLRWEEASGLHLEHIDADAMELRVVQAHVRGGIFPTKTESHKLLPLDADVLTVIQDHIRKLRDTEHPGIEKSILFPSRVGTYRGPSSVSKAWSNTSRKMELSWMITPHDLRRSYQNLLRQANVGSIVQQALMGHSTDAMTEHYSHVRMDEKREAQRNVVSLLDFRKTS